MQTKGISIVLHSLLEEGIYRAIWYREDYNINQQADSIVIDIGLNVGIATLFFAAKEFVKKIYAFESDKNVYEKAIYNIGLNKKVKDKIETFNVACACEDKEEVYVITEIESAGIAKRRPTTPEDCKTVSVNCVDSAKALGNIIDTHYGKESIIMKCDCEGAEYEIFYRLEETGYFNKIDAFVMEWHMNRRKEIEEIFSRNNYAYIIMTEPRHAFGLCYAIKIN